MPWAGLERRQIRVQQIGNIQFEAFAGLVPSAARGVDEIVEDGGFELSSMDRFLGDGPKVLASLYRGVAMKT